MKSNKTDNNKPVFARCDRQKPLLPCPHCGGKKIYHGIEITPSGVACVAVCQRCGAKTVGKSQQIAINRWNRRATK